VISQLAAAGKVKKKFSHCLDNQKGGGILAVGELVEPKLNTSPIVQKQYATLSPTPRSLAYMYTHTLPPPKGFIEI